MADYNSNSKATVENDSYSLNSWNARNVKDMNSKMGYHNMADRANSSCPSSMKAAKSNKQVMK